MGAKDITEKQLADYNDVFTDIINGELFGSTNRNAICPNAGFRTGSVLRYTDSSIRQMQSRTPRCA